MDSKHIVIAGGGLAGLTCAKDLVDRGARVTVLEGLPYLGGRASTFRDRDGEWVEQGLHVFLGIYSEFRKLLAEIGRPPEEVLLWTDSVHYQDPQGPHADFGADPIFSPLKTVLGALTQNDYVGLIDKLTLLPAAAPAAASLETLRRRYDGMTVTEWWQQVSGREDVLERILRPVCRGIQFTDPDQFSAYDFLGWVHDSIYDLPHLRLYGYRGARDELIFAPLGRYLTDRGATIRTGALLREIDYDSQRETVSGFALDGGERVVGDAYVAAVPAWVFAPLIPAALREMPFFATIGDLPVAPAISVQLWLDRTVTGNPDFYLVAGCLAPVYQEQSPHTYPVASGARISVIVSPADDLLEADDQTIIQHVTQPLRQANPALADAQIRKAVVLKHPQHLIRPLPGAMSARPGQATPVRNLFLAGDWTQQAFFGSQEGAVRSGKACADEVVRTLALDVRTAG